MKIEIGYLLESVVEHIGRVEQIDWLMKAGLADIIQDEDEYCE